MAVKNTEIINNLVNYNNIKIFQNKEFFNFSLDSILLPNFVKINKSTSKILDICTGNAPIPLILSQKTNALIYGVEIQKEIYDLAVKTVKINNLENRIILINKDAKTIDKDFESDTFDLITCNPPYFKNTIDSIKNDNIVKSIARHELMITLNDIIKISKKLLKNNGSLSLVHRTDRLIDIITLMRDNNIEPKRIRFIYSKKGRESNLVLIDGRKNGKPGLKILEPLIVHEDNGDYKSEILAMFGSD